MKETPRPPLRRWTPYVLPNMLTSLNLLAGFYAILRIINRDYQTAVMLILVAVVLDGMDGMAARLTRGSSAFGLEFDSMADLVSFGIAPSLLIYVWMLKPAGRVGWVAAFLYMACGALRLARFNVQAQDVQKYRFLGIPIPMAAAQIVTTYLLITHLGIDPRSAGATLAVIVTTYLTAFLMVSNILYRSTKSLTVRKRHSFYVPVLFILVTAIILINPQINLWVFSTAYILSGPVELLIIKTFALKKRPPEKEQAHYNPVNDKQGR